MKTQKGITLVALIITIVVLLILAVVSINSIQNEGIMSQAQNAADMWNASQANEQGTLGGYEETINKYIPNSNTNVKKISFTVSGYEVSTYYAEEGMTWEDWVESEYNVDEYYISEVGNGYDVLGQRNGIYIYTRTEDDMMDPVGATEKIVDGKDYYHTPAVPH